MLRRSRRRTWVLLRGLSILMMFVGWIEAGGVKNVPVKAMFLSGNLPGIAIPNKILNDQGGYYQEGGGNYVHLRGGDGSLCFNVVVGSRSGRSVLLLFDSQVAPPAPPENLGDSCGVPYYVPGSISTINWQFGTKNECVLSETPDAEGYYEMTIKDTMLNLLTMQDGQVAYAYLQPMWFYVADSKATKRNDSRDWYILDWEPNYVVVRASGWDGMKVTTWTITPVTAKFKHMKGETANDPAPQYYLYDNGTIPRWLISNARRGCFHGIYNLPYELIITRLQ
jgi:hypothetical protein